MRIWPLSHLGAHELSQQTVNICSTNALHAKNGYVPIIYAPQESTSVQNASVIILPVLKTIFQHHAELSLRKHPKNVVPMLINSFQTKTN